MPGKTLKELKNMMVTRVDLVDKGDNPEANITLFKRDQDPNNNPSNGEPGGGDVPTESQTGDSDDTIVVSPEGIGKLAEVFRKIFTTKGAESQMPEALKKYLESLPEDVRKSLEEPLKKACEGMTEEQVQEYISKLQPDTGSGDGDGDDNGQGGQSGDNDLQKQLDELKQENERLKKALTGTGDGGDVGDEDETEKFIKSLPEDQQEFMRKKLEQAQEAERLAKELQKEKLEKMYIEKAKELENLPSQAEEVGPVLKRIADHSEEDYKKIMEFLKAANEVAERTSIIMDQYGAAGGEGTAGDAWGQIEQKAKQLMEQNTELDKPTAVAKVLKQNPELYTQYQKEQKGVS